MIWIQNVTISLHVYFSTGGLNRHIHTYIFTAIRSFFFNNKVLFWDFSRMILICSLQFFFHVYDRWRNNVGVRVLRVLFLWKYIRIFLPSVSHVTPTPFTSLTACSKDFHYLMAQFWEIFLFFGRTLLPGLSLAPQWFHSTFPHPFSSFLFPQNHSITLIILPALFCATWNLS